jgi:lantibiotic leader peptide-processing serine protease
LRSTGTAARLVIATACAALALATVQAASAEGPPPGDLPNAPATPDNLSTEQWSLAQIRAFEAHEVTGGSPLVRVALIDSGIDPGHPEFAGRIDTANSASCLTGEVVTGRDATGEFVWRDTNGHGTHVAGIIAAGDNGFGIVGVAPHVQLVVVKVSEPGRPITPAAAECAFDYVATLNAVGATQIDVANASFAVDKGPAGPSDPLDFFCRSDAADHADIKRVASAVRGALRSGTTIVASAGNNNLDMAHPPTGNDCIRMPVELPGVIGVSSDGRFGQRATPPNPGPSNFGVGVIDLVAPGGDDLQGGPVQGRVLSTFPSYIFVPPMAPPNIVDGSPTATYRYSLGTSQAAAHVSGVAALVISRFGDTQTLQNGKLRPGQVEAILERTAEPKPCPPDPMCEGGESYNGFFGHGEVDALSAVLADA